MEKWSGMQQDDLEQIIIGCNNGNEESFVQLVDIYSKRLFGYFFRLTGNRQTSEDLLSELFIKLVERISSYRGGSFDGWLFTIASNIFHDHLRFKQRQQIYDRQQSQKLNQLQSTVQVLQQPVATELVAPTGKGAWFQREGGASFQNTSGYYSQSGGGATAGGARRCRCCRATGR